MAGECQNEFYLKYFRFFSPFMNHFSFSFQILFAPSFALMMTTGSCDGQLPKEVGVHNAHPLPAHWFYYPLLIVEMAETLTVG